MGKILRYILSAAGLFQRVHSELKASILASALYYILKNMFIVGEVTCCYALVFGRPANVLLPLLI